MPLSSPSVRTQASNTSGAVRLRGVTIGHYSLCKSGYIEWEFLSNLPRPSPRTLGRLARRIRSGLVAAEVR